MAQELLRIMHVLSNWLRNYSDFFRKLPRSLVKWHRNYSEYCLFGENDTEKTQKSAWKYCEGQLCRKSWGAEIWRECSPPTMFHMSHVTCHMSCHGTYEWIWIKVERLCTPNSPGLSPLGCSLVDPWVKSWQGQSTIGWLQIPLVDISLY